MNKTFDEADELVSDLLEIIDENRKPAQVEIIVCPPLPYLEMVRDMTEDTPVLVGAQNVSQFETGAYTGEVSAAMLRSMNIGFCIVGHSERRKYFHEDDESLLTKVKLLLKNDIVPIFCCGELLNEREAGKHRDMVRQQLQQTVFQLKEKEFERIILAYEPVWAIGTGVTATPEQAQEMQAYIRSLIMETFGSKQSDDKLILYGGSCNSSNAQKLFSQPDVDGGLIGGASLDAEEFFNIVRAAGS